MFDAPKGKESRFHFPERSFCVEPDAGGAVVGRHIVCREMCVYYIVVKVLGS